MYLENIVRNALSNAPSCTLQIEDVVLNASKHLIVKVCTTSDVESADAQSD